MQLKRIVDLSHTVIPGEEEYRLEVDSRMVEGWPQFAKYNRQEGHWYLISEVMMNTHVGTHIEFPYHHVKDGPDSSEYPLDQLVGEAIVVDISQWEHNQKIPLEGLKKVADHLIQPGDIALFYTGNDRYYRTERQHDRPWFEPAAIEWLVEKKIKIMGVDTSGIEVRNEDGSPSVGQPNHDCLLGAGIGLVEYAANLGEFLNERFVCFILPVKIKGVEAFPIRMIGVSDEEAS
jgi:arylformamidase